MYKMPVKPQPDKEVNEPEPAPAEEKEEEPKRHPKWTPERIKRFSESSR